MNNLSQNELKKLSQRLSCPIYIVGGAVRNYVANLPVSETDIDICGDFDVDILRKDDAIRVTSINKKLGTCQIKIGDHVFEYTRFRKEKYSGGHHAPSCVEFHNSIEVDALRRDFTCNSVYYDVLSDKIVDVLGGVEDIQKKVVRTCSDNTFESDGLRIMRAIRFAAQLGFYIEENSGKKLKNQAYLLRDISPDRKRDELEKILHADKKYGIIDAHYRGLKLMQEYDIFPHILPEIKALEGVKQNPKYHAYDVIEHTFCAVKYARDDIRLAALLHDTGKPACLDGEGHMKGHNIVSEQLARIALGKERLNYPTKVIEETARLCFNHMFDLKGDVSDSKMKLFVAENFDIIDKIAALREADGKATGMQSNQKINRFLHFKKILIDEKSPVFLNQLDIDGKVLEIYRIPNKERSALLKQLQLTCILNPSLNNASWLTEQIEKAAKNYSC